MFARQKPLTNFKIWVPCGKPLKNAIFLFLGVIWVPQEVRMVPKIFSSENLIIQLQNDVSHIFFGLLEQKLFQKIKGRQINLQGCTFFVGLVWYNWYASLKNIWKTYSQPKLISDTPYSYVADYFFRNSRFPIGIPWEIIFALSEIFERLQKGS